MSIWTATHYKERKIDVKRYVGSSKTPRLRSCRIANPSLAEYHVPVHIDAPEIEVLWTDIPDPQAPWGTSYNPCMRRWLAISLLLLAVSSAIAPLFALAADPQSALPACCRRNGVHHCESAGAPSPASGPLVRALENRCPAFPKALARAQASSTGLPGTPATVVHLATHPGISRQTQTVPRAAFSRSKQNRGPPSVRLS